jgi:hypothetical protein
MVVAGFEIGSAALICLSIKQLHRDKLVRGVSVWPVSFFALWGWWNLFWYAHINAPWAWWAGIAVVLTNTTWALQMAYYLRKEKRGL